MDRDELKYWVTLQSAEGIGAATFRKLVQKFGSPRAALAASPEEIATIPRLAAPLVAKIVSAKENLAQVEALMLHLDEKDVKIVTLQDSDYPAPLRQVKNPPPILYIYGAYQEADRRSVAIVGSREATEYGLKIARGFGQRLAERGYTVVSGYAKGVDTESHLGALEAGGRTIMVLSMGLMHFKLRDAGLESFEYLRKNGAVISEMYPTANWTVGSAMARNRLVVGLARAVLVVECKLESGTMNAAEVAQEMNKKLFVLKYQQVTEASRGNEALLQAGATAIHRFGDIDLIESAIR